MAPQVRPLSHLSNPLATPEQLSSSGSQLDGVPADLETSILHAGTRLTQAAGILLRLPQEVIAAAIVTFSRFWIGAEGGSLREHGAREVSAACTYLTAKLSVLPKSPRSVLNVYAYLGAAPSVFAGSEAPSKTKFEDVYLSEGDYQRQRLQLTKLETIILKTLGFQTHVSLPHTLCINYIQALDVFKEPSVGRGVARRAYRHLNASLLNPQLLYLTHQPPALAVAAIYLAARELGARLPEDEWWEVFDTDREELGFLVVAMLSLEGFVKEEKTKWESRTVPLTVEELEHELDYRGSADSKAPQSGEDE